MSLLRMPRTWNRWASPAFSVTVMDMTTMNKRADIDKAMEEKTVKTSPTYPTVSSIEEAISSDGEENRYWGKAFRILPSNEGTSLPERRWNMAPLGSR